VRVTQDNKTDRQANPQSRWLLVAPFLGLAGLFGVYFGFWHFVGQKVLAVLQENGTQWEQAKASGFPARLTLDIDQPAWADETMRWQNDALRLTVMPWRPNHAVLDMKGAHKIGLPRGDITIRHAGNMASAVVDLTGPLRLAFELQKPDARFAFGGTGVTMQADSFAAFLRRRIDAPGNDGAPRYDMALRGRNLVIDDNAPLPRFDMQLDIPAAMLGGMENIAQFSGQQIGVEKLTLERLNVTLLGKGVLRFGADGLMAGQLDFDVVNLVALLETLEEFGLADRRERKRLLFLAGLASALTGKTGDRLSVPLIFKNGRSMIGTLDIGSAPRWR
jgi:hypothetical protein